MRGLCGAVILSDMRAIGALLSLFLVTPAPDAPQQSCLHYRPASVTLEGTLTRRGYRDSALILTLPDAICVAPDSSSDEGDKHLELGVRAVQLAIGTDTLRTQLRAVTGSKLQVTGELFHATGGHQVTRVLLWVIQIRAA